MAQRRIVVTGLGLVTPLGLGVKETWNNLIHSKSGLISTSQLPNAAQFKDITAQVVGAVPIGPASDNKYNSDDHFSPREIRRFSKFIQFSIVATKEALTDANWFPKTQHDQEMTGCCIGSGIGSIEDLYNNSVSLEEKGYRRVQPLMVPRLLTNMAAGNTSIYFGLKGPNHAVATACATGLHAIGDASRFIKDGYADVMVAGASESVVHPVALAGFARAKSLVTTFNEQPELASRPFDKDRAGFVLGEGAGVMVLEELEHALNRGAKIYGEVVGYGLTGDAYHITSPDTSGDGAKRAMEFAIKQAGIEPSQVGYINAHATSTLLGDRAENYAIKRLFGEENPNLAVSSTKGAIGHLLGASGSVEAIFTMLAIYNKVLPPTLNLNNLAGQEEDVKEDFIFNYVPKISQSIDKLDYALSNSFGFGGTNASICLGKYEQ